MSGERPILFSGPMVRAILEGRKTQTRRVCIPRFDDRKPCEHYRCEQWPEGVAMVRHCEHGSEGQTCPYGGPGLKLWVRETYLRTTNKDGTPGRLIYKADGWHTVNGGAAGWRPSIHMPRWASRLTLEIVSVRVERVQDISEQDAMAEGCTHTGLSGLAADEIETAREQFAHLWDSINAPRGYGWHVNPWVWAVEFRRVQE